MNMGTCPLEQDHTIASLLSCRLSMKYQQNESSKISDCFHDVKQDTLIRKTPGENLI